MSLMLTIAAVCLFVFICVFTFLIANNIKNILKSNQTCWLEDLKVVYKWYAGKDVYLLEVQTDTNYRDTIQVSKEVYDTTNIGDYHRCKISHYPFDTYYFIVEKDEIFIYEENKKNITASKIISWAICSCMDIALIVLLISIIARIV